MNLILGFCNPRSSAQIFLMATVNIQVHCPVLWLQIWIDNEKVGRYLASQASPILFRSADRFQNQHTKSNRHCGTEWGWLASLADTVEMAYLGMEMKSESCVGGRGRENWLVKIAWISACIKPDCQTTCMISKNASQRKKEWENNYGYCMLNAR